MEPEEEDIVVLTDENGEEHEFELVDVFDVDGREYAVLASAEEEAEEDDEAIVLRVDRDDSGNEVLVDIEDDDEWERVAERWDQILDEESDGEWDDEDEETAEDDDDDEDDDEEMDRPTE